MYHIFLGTYSFQATCLWRDGAGPQNYRTETYLSDLNRIAKEHREDTNITPSLFSKTRVGTVQEFISYETGLIRYFLYYFFLLPFCLLTFNFTAWIRIGRIKPYPKKIEKPSQFFSTFLVLYSLSRNIYPRICIRFSWKKYPSTDPTFIRNDKYIYILGR